MKTKLENKKKKIKLKKCKSATFAPTLSNTAYDIESLHNISDEEIDISSNNFEMTQENSEVPFKAIINKNSPKKSSLMFNINISDLKFAHCEFNKRYFKCAFDNKLLINEMEKFQVLENILQYK
jgi:hypothetical protein